jgi:hypothetical protein
VSDVVERTVRRASEKRSSSGELNAFLTLHAER